MKVVWLLLTLVTGLIDSFSYLVLGHVFVANITGNIAFLAFSLSGAAAFSISNALLATGSFLLGAFFGGCLVSRCQRKDRLLSCAAAFQTLFIGGAIVLIAFVGTPLSSEYTDVLIVLMGLAMSLQTVVARRLVPDVPTTVLTLILAGIGADIAGGSGSKIFHRMSTIGALLLGAYVGCLLLRFNVSLPIIVALILLAFVAGMARSVVVDQPLQLAPGAEIATLEPRQFELLPLEALPK